MLHTLWFTVAVWVKDVKFYHFYMAGSHYRLHCSVEAVIPSEPARLYKPRCFC